MSVGPRLKVEVAAVCSTLTASKLVTVSTSTAAAAWDHAHPLRTTRLSLLSISGTC